MHMKKYLENSTYCQMKQTIYKMEKICTEILLDSILCNLRKTKIMQKMYSYISKILLQNTCCDLQKCSCKISSKASASTTSEENQISPSYITALLKEKLVVFQLTNWASCKPYDIILRKCMCLLELVFNGLLKNLEI